MNIDVIRIHYQDKDGWDNYSYKYIPFEYCCDKLKNAEYIVFSDDYDYLDPNDCCDEYDCTIPRFSVIVDKPVAWEDYTESAYYKINYCPFCGQKININVVREEDRTGQYAVMKYLREVNNELSLKTDSKSEYDKLFSEMREIDQEINEFMSFGEYHYDTLKYKGYEGSIEYSPEDMVWHGKILNVKDLVDYSSETEGDIENQFHLAVDDYIEFKKEIGRDD